MSDDEKSLSRRSFLRVAGITGAVVGCSPKPTAQKLYPYLTPPENIIPGTPTWYRTVCRACEAGCGVTAKTREGRVIKLEGNPEDPIGRGALCARGQASVQELYAPDRLKGPMQRSPSGIWTPLSWDDALAKVSAALTHARDANKAGVRILSRPEAGSAGELQKAFLSALGAEATQRRVLEPFDLTALRAAGEQLFGRRELPGFDLAAAKTVVSIGADFLETWLSPVELTRGFTTGRARGGADRTRLICVGPRLSATAGSADHWMMARGGTERAVVLGLLRWLVDPANAVPGLKPEAPQLFSLCAPYTPAHVEMLTGVPAAELVALARELATRRPSALLGPGPASAGEDATALAVAIQWVNYVLGNIDQTVLYGVDAQVDPPSTFQEVKNLLGEMAAGKVQVLFLHHADPIGTLPEAAGAREALAQVPLVVSFSDRLDASTQKAHLILPDRHALESFGDVSTRKGVLALCQPSMTPLAETRESGEVLLALGKKLGFAAPFSSSDFYEYVGGRVTPSLGTDPRAAWMRGGSFAPSTPEPVSLASNALATAPPPVLASQGEGLSLVAFPTALRGDGRMAKVPWLNEVPDVTSTVSWTAWAELSPATASRLAVDTGDVVEVKTAAGAVELILYVYPGLRDDAVAIPLGGTEALAVVGARTDTAGALAWSGARATVRKTGKVTDLPQAEGMPAPEAGDVIKHVTPEAPTLPAVAAAPSMYPPVEHPKHRWAMTIDLDRCTGCQACVVACYAENNIPVMGPEFAEAGRNMAWLRIERYFDPVPQNGVDFLPMLCQQCDNAPCEPVCPVDATYHTQEGLNAQVYNRCVGTRYCSNNCPYKVRTFNYKDPEFPSPLDFQLNPDVTVRSKGVMEKCTFCVQRVRSAENSAKSEGRRVRDGEAIPACAQTCPGQAIVFGDANDPGSRVSLLRKSARGFRVLEELNTQPAVTYLARTKGGKP